MPIEVEPSPTTTGTLILGAALPYNHSMAVDLPELIVPDAAAWRGWLEANHSSAKGVSLVLHKKGGVVTALTYAAALDEALCFGWIDGQADRRDDESYRQRFTPRKQRSAWSARNVGHVERLEAASKMHDAGRAAVESAKSDGRWEAAYAGQSTAQLPADLAEAIAVVPRAQAMFEVLTATNRYALIYRVNMAKRPQTRARKIAAFVEMLAQQKSPYPQRRMPDEPERNLP